jgi:hypothetical protein
MDLFPTAEMGVDEVGLPFYLCLNFNALYFVFKNAY